MKTNFTNPKMIALLLFLFAAPFLAKAEIYPLYMCGGATATFKPDAAVESALAVGDKVVWQEFTAADAPVGNPTSLTVAAIGVAPTFTTDAAITVGEHIFKVFVIAVNPSNCSGDLSDAFKFFVLPNKTLALTTTGTATYCENITTPDAVITATPTVTTALPENVTYEYTWSATKGTDPTVLVGTTLGTAATTATTGTLTLTTKAVGTYAFSASVKYAVPATSTLKSGDSAGCAQASSNTQSVTVAPKPGKPSVTFS